MVQVDDRHAGLPGLCLAVSVQEKRHAAADVSLRLRLLCAPPLQACNRQNMYCVPLYDSLGEVRLKDGCCGAAHAAQLRRCACCTCCGAAAVGNSPARSATARSVHFPAILLSIHCSTPLSTSSSTPRWEVTLCRRRAGTACPLPGTLLCAAAVCMGGLHRAGSAGELMCSCFPAPSRHCCPSFCPTRSPPSPFPPLTSWACWPRRCPW